MISSSKDVDSSSNSKASSNKAASMSSSPSSSWLRLKDPRIVRVSRAFGGKDRHSKVCTIRGLRDRRVRLSVPTAIQLYDLQDRLGLSQPSKVVDWLLNAAKGEIDQLPPLPFPPAATTLGLNHHQALILGNSSSDRTRNGEIDEGLGSTFLPKSSTTVVPSTSFFHSESPSTSDVGFRGYTRQGFATSQTELQSNLSLSSGPQNMVHTVGAAAAQAFNFPSMEINDHQRHQVNNFHVVNLTNGHLNLLPNSLAPISTTPYNSTSQAMKPFQFSMSPRFLNRQDGSERDEWVETDEFPCK